MSEPLNPQEEDAATSSGYNSKRFVSLVRFATVLIDQTTEANLTPDEMRFVAAFYRNGIELIANDIFRRKDK